MFVLHLLTTVLLKRGIRAVTLLRWEIAYYGVLLSVLLVPSFRMLVIPAVALAALHATAWLYSEVRHDQRVPGRQMLIAVQIFDSAEAAALAWIAYRLAASP